MKNIVGGRWQLNLEGLQAGYPNLCGFPGSPGATYDGPTLFVGGERGGMMTRDLWPKCLEWFPNARLEMLPTGHFVRIAERWRGLEGRSSRELIAVQCEEG